MVDKIIGDYIGTTWKDFLILPGLHFEGESTPDDVDISTDIAGVKLKIPFMTAAMRSVTGKRMALSASKIGMMPVLPRGLVIDKQVGIAKYVKENAVDVGEIESESRPTTVGDTDTLGVAIKRARQTGHSNVPVVTRKYDLVGMFQYNPTKHNDMDVQIPIRDVMHVYKGGPGKKLMGVCTTRMKDDEIKKYLKRGKLRFVPVIDDVGRLEKLVFLQNFEAYKIGAAIDTHDGWQERADALVDAGVDIIFIDTSDAHKPFSRKVVEKHAEITKEYRERGRYYPPICAGNIVTPEAFVYLADAGADIIKLGMGPGSICSTNQVLRVGAPPFWSLVEVSRRRDSYASSYGKHIPLIPDGGMEDTGHINVALTHGNALMGAKLFGCFFESEGDRIDLKGNPHTADQNINEADIAAIKIYGEGSPEALEITGDLKRYETPFSGEKITTFQGVSGIVEYRGRLKPGVEGYTRTLKEAMYHAGVLDLKTFRDKARLIRLSEEAKNTARPHGIELIGD